MEARLTFPIGAMIIALGGCSASRGVCEPPRQAGSAVTVYDISPAAGPTTPPTAVTVFGEGFSQDTKIYFDGFMARETVFHDESHLEVLTPYMRPGEHQVLVKSQDSQPVKLEIPFTTTPAPVDSRVDAALSQARAGQVSEALSVLDDIARNDSDHQVRAFARYQEGELYFAQGDWQRWLGETMGIYLNAKLAGPSVQSYWPYGVANARACYLLNRSGDPEVDALNFDMAIQWDATGATEPHFRRAIFRARSGKLKEATEDIQFCLRAEPANAAYLALAAFNAAQMGDKSASAKLYQRHVQLSPVRSAPIARRSRFWGRPCTPPVIPGALNFTGPRLAASIPWRLALLSCKRRNISGAVSRRRQLCCCPRLLPCRPVVRKRRRPEACWQEFPPNRDFVAECSAPARLKRPL